MASNLGSTAAAQQSFSKQVESFWQVYSLIRSSFHYLVQIKTYLHERLLLLYLIAEQTARDLFHTNVQEGFSFETA